ncbi:MAG: lipase family alpha/beta hydrolase [Promethearchaeota archaeon]
MTQTMKKFLLKVFFQNKRYLIVFIPFFFINMWFFAVFYSLSKIPYYTVSIGSGTDLVGSSVYFVHGYNGNDSQFHDMIKYLNSTDYFNRFPNINITPLFFNYYEKYSALQITKTQIHNIEGGISTYAGDFFEQLCRTHGSATQISIVAHSLGGLIVREMLRLYRQKLEQVGIVVVRVITLGTPHFGTVMLNHPLIRQLLWLIGLDSKTLIAESITPGSSFLNQLNENPSTYMRGIDWYFVAGVSLHPLVFSFQEIIFGGVPCDGIVDCESALAIGLPFQPVARIILQKDHDQLIHDPQSHESYEYIEKWLSVDY